MADPKSPVPLQLTEVEILKLTNLKLRMQLLEADRQQLMAQEDAWGKEVGARLGVDMRQHRINLDNGQVVFDQQLADRTGGATVIPLPTPAPVPAPAPAPEK